MGSPNLLSGLQAGSMIERERLAQQQQNQSGAQRLFDNLLKVQAIKRQAALDEQNRQEAQAKLDATNIANATTAANLRQTAAAKTPIAEAPQVDTGKEDVAFLNPDEAAFAGVQAPQTGTVGLGAFTTPERANPIQLPLSVGGGKVDIPLQYQEETDAAAKRAAELAALSKQRERPTTTLTPEDEALGIGKVGTEMDLEEYKARGGLATKPDRAPMHEPALDTSTGKLAFVVDPAQFKETNAKGQPRYQPIRNNVNVNVGGAASDNAKDAVAGMKEGTIPPQLPGRATKEYLAVMAEARRQGYDLATANKDWLATTTRLRSLNGTQQVRLGQAVDTAAEALGIIEDLAGKWKGGRFPILNKANLVAAKGGAYGQEAQNVATQLDAQISDLTSELAQVYMGGNTPTDHALELAAKNLQSNWSEGTLKKLVDQSRQNLRIRRNSMNNFQVAGASPDNPYAIQGGAAPVEGGAVPEVKSQADYDRLPAGAKYTFQGKPYTKGK